MDLMVELMDPVDDQQPQPPEATVVTLCGSMRFEAELAEVERRLTLAGCLVLSPSLPGLLGLPDLLDAEQAGGDLREMLGRLHLQRVRMADEVYVVDPGGYVGESTRREIARAELLGLPVRYLSRERPAPTGDEPAG